MKNMLRTAVVAAAGSMVLMLALATDGARAVAQGMKPLLVQVMNTAAEPIPVVSPVDRVTLLQGGAPTGICPSLAREARRVLPDGTVVQSFTVPPGKMLVLTDFQAVVRPAAGWSVGEVASAGVFVGSGASTVIRAYGTVTAEAVSAGIVPVSVHLESGGVIGANLPVCLTQRIEFQLGVRPAELQDVRLHGYLIAE